MLQISVIGHIGADASVKEANGKKFVSFNVAHTERWNGADGVAHESTMWVSCALNGDGGGLLPYLKRGACVFVQGRGSVRVYSSQVERGMKAGINLSVDRIELVGGKVDDVPREVLTPEEVVIQTSRAYFIDPQDYAAYYPKKGKVTILHDVRGGQYQLDENGFVWPIPASNETGNE